MTSVGLLGALLMSMVAVGAAALWWAPVRSLRAVRRPMFFRFGNGVRVGLVVSRQRINRVVANDLKTPGQAVSAGTFCTVLYADGASATSPPQLPLGGTVR